MQELDTSYRLDIPHTVDSVLMDSPTERMPIACVHCAKAKAKCDKKVGSSQSREAPRPIHCPTGKWSSENRGWTAGYALPLPSSVDDPSNLIFLRLTSSRLGPLLKMCEQTDCVPVSGYSKVITYPSPDQPPSTSHETSFRACFTQLGLIPGCSTLSLFCPAPYPGD